MSAPFSELVSLLHVQRERTSNATESNSVMANSQGSTASVHHPVAYSAVVDPNDETIETEITDEMISLALEAVEHEQIWPFCGDVPVVAREPRPSAEIIRFPGC